MTGILRLLVVPESRVSIDGASLGLVSRRELPLSFGTHTVRVEHPDYQPLQRRVTIREGAPESLVIDLAEKGIRRIRTPPPPRARFAASLRGRMPRRSGRRDHCQPAARAGGLLPAAAPPPHPALARGLALMRDGDFEGAVLELDAAVRKLEAEPAAARHRAWAYVYLGVAYLELEQEAVARGKFREALARDPALQLVPAEFSAQSIRVFEGVRAEDGGRRSAASGPAASRPLPGASAGTGPRKKRDRRACSSRCCWAARRRRARRSRWGGGGGGGDAGTTTTRAAPIGGGTTMVPGPSPSPSDPPSTTTPGAPTTTTPAPTTTTPAPTTTTPGPTTTTPGPTTTTTQPPATTQPPGDHATAIVHLRHLRPGERPAHRLLRMHVLGFGDPRDLRMECPDLEPHHDQHHPGSRHGKRQRQVQRRARPQPSHRPHHPGAGRRHLHGEPEHGLFGPAEAAGWSALLALDGGAGQITVNGSRVTYQAPGIVQLVDPAGPARVEALVVTAAGRPGTWRFQLPAGAAPGSLHVVAGDVAVITADTVTFRLAGRPGERLVFTFARP